MGTLSSWRVEALCSRCFAPVMSKLSGWEKLKRLPPDDPRRVRARTYARENLKRKGGRKRTPEEQRVHSRRMTLRHQYGLSPEDYDFMYACQNGRCAICQQPERARASKGAEPKRLAIDHNHATSRNRGLLCQECNTAIGSMHEDILRLQAAIAYLQRYA